MQPRQDGFTIENPTNQEAYTKIKAGISRHKTVIIAGECTVEYDGRAASRLESGERLVIFKSDGSA
ncbi:MAG: endonuclease NucS, partial [Candidatus Thorarchaeota archaeon]